MEAGGYRLPLSCEVGSSRANGQRGEFSGLGVLGGFAMAPRHIELISFPR